VLDSFPGPSLMGVPAGLPFSLPGHAILLPKCPVQSVFAIRYLDMAGTTQTMPRADYTVDTACEPARVTPVFGSAWPVSLPQIGAVSSCWSSLRATAMPPASPPGIKSWIKLRVGSLYAHREEVALLASGKIENLVVHRRPARPVPSGAGRRTAPQRRPAAGRPALRRLYERGEPDAQHALDGVPIQQDIVQVDVWDVTYQGALTAGDAFAAALQAAFDAGTIAGVQRSRRGRYDAEARLHGFMYEFSFWSH
jgi:hypothetical protein